MSDFATMKTRVAREINRSDLDDMISDAINSAIAHYGVQRWSFNECEAQTNTVADQEKYAIPEDCVKLDRLKVKSGDSFYGLTPRTLNVNDEWGGTQTRGIPTDYTVYGEEFRLYPVPQQAYELRLFYVIRPVQLSDGTDSSEWTDQALGEPLIRERAKASVLIDLRDSEALRQASMHGVFLSVREKQAYDYMRRNTNSLTRSGFITPTSF